ncbi:MAG TPA: multidrug ABC transporter ATP-binding protein [Acholeplasmatales bacterium]|nr:multidrug ABC transporter ATP-binding protein [Acholeplasmatales bacterium]
MIAEVTMDMLVTNKMGTMIDIVNSYGPTSNNNQFLNTIVSNGIIMLALVLIGVVSGILSGVFANLASQKFANDLRKDLFSKIMHLSFQQSDDFSTASLVTRVTNDVTAVQTMIAMAIRMFIRSLSMFILGIVFTLQISKQFMIILAVALPLEILIMVFFMIKAFPMFSIVQTKLDKVNSVVHENLTGARVVKAFSKEDYEYNRFVEANDTLTSITLKVNKLMAIIMPLFMLIVYAGMIAIYYIGANSQFDAMLYLENFATSIDPKISVGEMEKATTYIMMIMSSLLMIGMTFANMARAAASGKRINEVLETPDIICDGNLDVTTLKETGTIEFKNVDFAYPNASASVLENINLKIEKGETVAIVGATGSGKTTLVNLITRFYDVTKGEILVDGENIKNYKLVDLRNKIAIVLQKAELFAGTIKENIKWGNPNATDEEVEWAANIAQAIEFIDSKEKKFDEYVEEKGTSLSGGQRQRLSIARAIVKKPEILIFDDSTSALDLVTEAKLYKAMRDNIADTTKIVVAQRIATAKNADKIVVLDGGTIIAYDTHENLLANCEIYQDIYNSQLKREGDING